MVCRGIPELWHTIESEGILDLRNDFRRIQLYDLKLKIWEIFGILEPVFRQSGIPGVLKGSLSDFPMLITYNYALILIL